MYNSSIKRHGTGTKFKKHQEIPHKAFYNDMSKVYMRPEFLTCDVIYSEISWLYGYKGFNDKALNEPEGYSCYIDNINRAICELKKPAFIVCGKNVRSHFIGAKMYPVSITTSGENITGCTLYIWNYNRIPEQTTSELLKKLQKEFHKCLDFSCGYGEHLLGFDDFVGCDINRDCITYLSLIAQEKEIKDGKTKN